MEAAAGPYQTKQVKKLQSLQLDLVDNLPLVVLPYPQRGICKLAAMMAIQKVWTMIATQNHR